MYQQVILYGNLGKDPEVKYLPSGQAVCNCSVATSDRWLAKDGSKQERTEWHRVVAWGKLGEAIAEHGRKGATVFVVGQIETKSYDKGGTKVYSTQIVAKRFDVLTRRNADSDSPAGQDMGYGRDSMAADADDIPF